MNVVNIYVISFDTLIVDETLPQTDDHTDMHIKTPNFANLLYLNKHISHIE